MVSMEHMNILKATFLVYVIPMILLIVGIVGSYYILDSIGFNGAKEVVAAIIGIILMALSYIYLKINDNKFRESREYVPVVTKILFDL